MSVCSSFGAVANTGVAVGCIDVAAAFLIDAAVFRTAAVAVFVVFQTLFVEHQVPFAARLAELQIAAVDLQRLRRVEAFQKLNHGQQHRDILHKAGNP